MTTYSDPRTNPNAALTFTGVGLACRGLGLDVDTRAAVARACRKISALNGRGTVSTTFSPYTQGASPTRASLKQIIEDPDHAGCKILTHREIRACKAFLTAREAVGAPTIVHDNRSRWPGRQPLHNFGSFSTSHHLPSSRWP